MEDGVPSGLRILRSGLEASASPRPAARVGGLRSHGDRMVPPGHLDFAVNVWPGGPPEWLRAELAASLERISSYPDEAEATAALAERHARRPEEVLPLNGAAEASWLLAAALRPRRAVVVHPTFTEPEAALRAQGRIVMRAFRDPETFALDPATVPDDADLVVLGNPNNPTGNLEAARTIEALARPGRVLVVDEAFMEFCPGEPESLASRTGLPGLVVVRSLTKLWSLPGLRAGYLLAPAGLVARLQEVRQPWPVNAPALAAMVACARAEDEARKRAEEVAEAREVLAARLAEIPGLRVWPSAANFLLLRVPDGSGLHDALLVRRVAVRPAGTFPGLTPDHLRVSVRRPEENERLVEAMREVLG
ncbi:MAG TPA: Rv2231c family pyridoxal phosphate-dependent protein CobC [Actinomycetota bacterium]|nr:Rv2231c family pyridoxal phosphate-dependent protein CobC [Actinomycetota bacterium]